MIAQVANILFYLGPRLKLAPRDEAGRLWLHQLQLTVTDFVKEIHDTHHPIGGGLYYEDQKPEAKRYARSFLDERAPKYLGYFETVLKKSGGPYVLGRKFSYVDLSLFQLIEGLRYAFPKAMKRIERKVPSVVGVHDRVAKRPRIKAYLASTAAHRVQRERHFPALSGIGRVDAHPCASSGLPPAVTGFAAISVKAITHGAVPLLTQLWMVPRCTSTSPAFRCTLPMSSSMSISPDITTA